MKYTLSCYLKPVLDGGYLLVEFMLEPLLLVLVTLAAQYLHEIQT